MVAPREAMVIVALLLVVCVPQRCSFDHIDYRLFINDKQFVVLQDAVLRSRIIQRRHRMSSELEENAVR
jgi:hypothetical protein